ncbi:MAG: flagellar M-ring protein FliF [Acetobacteraceae bacterium]|nr:flagellar M-ring protein FliF [Acetobacteraceae bacterium]
MKALIEGLKALGPARLAAMGAVGLGTLGLLALLALRGGGERMALLYGDLDLRESAQVTEQLTRQHISYKLEGQGSQILVPEDQVARARVLLAKEGLPSGGSVGYEIFDRSDGLTANQFQQQMNQTRALEGELARTIRAVQGVRAARVHLVLPHREPFAREHQDAQASVLLTMAGVARVDREGVQAILNLVAAAVPGLRPQNISIIDSRGGVLARAGEPTGPAAAAAGAEEIRRTSELHLARAVEEMLERTVGPGHVRAEAAVEMDFDHLNETQERYDPDGQVVRSSQTVNSNSHTTEAANNVSVQNNLPNADAGANSSTGSQEGRQEETTNYEIGRTVRTLIREQPQIRRISLAVMIDGTETPGPDGKPVWAPRSGDELARISALVRSAIGFNEQRGDHVEVASMRFSGMEDGPSGDQAGALGVSLERTDLLRLAQTGLLGVVGVLALLFVLRPMVLRLTTAQQTALANEAGSSAAGTARLAGEGGYPALPGGMTPALEGSGPAGLLAGESSVSVGNINGQLRPSSIAKIAEMVDRYPEASLAIMRGWITQRAN